MDEILEGFVALREGLDEILEGFVALREGLDDVVVALCPGDKAWMVPEIARSFAARVE